MTRELPGELFLGRNDGMQISVESPGGSDIATAPTDNYIARSL